MVAVPPSHPASSYEDAVARARVFMALDDDTILPEARTALLDHGAKAPLAVVLFHGITNNPAQYRELAPLVHKTGANVFVPRMPEHGDKDRMTPRIAKLTAEMLLASASEAVDIAFGLGERVALLGISMGGSLAAFFGQYRSIALAVPVAPDFALLQLPYGVSRLLARIFLALPNFFFWWDPRAGLKQRPLTAYPRCSTHALMQSLRVGDDVHAAANQRRQLAERIVTVVNRCDPAVNNEAAEEIAKDWCGWNRNGVAYVELRNLPENHDIIDPANPLAQTALVYPKLLEILTG
ncbi:MAG TPA: alpha/beta fold hydrolase [Candidatus Baltobacteraceae bacterium]|nr:alpha/beta fold hydrolase [Candidatus Baltobacteraceae bacterium]